VKNTVVVYNYWYPIMSRVFNILPLLVICTMSIIFFIEPMEYYPRRFVQILTFDSHIYSRESVLEIVYGRVYLSVL